MYDIVDHKMKSYVTATVSTDLPMPDSDSEQVIISVCFSAMNICHHHCGLILVSSSNRIFITITVVVVIISNNNVNDNKKPEKAQVLDLRHRPTRRCSAIILHNIINYYSYYHQRLLSVRQC